MQPFSPSLTPTLLSHTHLNRESAAVAALPEALAQWTGLELPPVLHDGWCLCLCLYVCVCVGGWVLVSLSPCLGVKRLLPFPTPASLVSLPSIHPSIHPSLFFFISPSLSLPLLPLLESLGHCGAERCWVLFSCCCQLSPRPLQDKAVIAPGTAGLSSSSSKQICCNFICNWALNWEQIEAAL